MSDQSIPSHAPKLLHASRCHIRRVQRRPFDLFHTPLLAQAVCFGELRRVVHLLEDELGRTASPWQWAAVACAKCCRAQAGTRQNRLPHAELREWAVGAALQQSKCVPLRLAMSYERDGERAHVRDCCDDDESEGASPRRCRRHVAPWLVLWCGVAF
jgi:hypothetical protein